MRYIFSGFYDEATVINISGIILVEVDLNNFNHNEFLEARNQEVFREEVFGILDVLETEEYYIYVSVKDGFVFFTNLTDDEEEGKKIAEMIQLINNL